MKTYCALCCIAKDEDAFLKEWLAYHALIGFEHFIIYDNLSASPIIELLEGWADPGRVTVIRNPEPLSQKIAYMHCLKRFGPQFKWIAFLDLDEFIRLTPACKEYSDIRIFLSGFEPYAGIGVNWRMFSSAGHEVMPQGPVISNYTRSLGDDIHIKSIVQPAKVQYCANPHAFLPKAGEYAVNADYAPIPPGFPFTPPATAEIAVHHYFYKSRQCFAAKIAKGNPCNIERRMRDFDRHLGLPVQRDDSLAALGAHLKTCLRNTGGALPKPDEPKALSGGVAPENGADHLAASRHLLAKGRVRQALLHLCRAVLYTEQAGGSDPVFALEIWNLRAKAAGLCNNTLLAEHCLRQALRLGAGRETYALLAELLLQQGKRAEAKSILNILRVFSNHETTADNGQTEPLSPDTTGPSLPVKH